MLSYAQCWLHLVPSCVDGKFWVFGCLKVVRKLIGIYSNWWNSWYSLILAMNRLYTLRWESLCKSWKKLWQQWRCRFVTFLIKINVACCDRLVDVTPGLGWTTYFVVSLIFWASCYYLSWIWVSLCIVSKCFVFFMLFLHWWSCFANAYSTLKC